MTAGNKNPNTVPVVSVIMPAYNAEKTLAASAVSVLDQSFKELELIIIDDGSTDGTASVCRELEAYDGRVRFVSTANSGPASARNTGLDMARGEYVAFVDSDDLLVPEMLEKLVRPMNEGAALAVCGASVEYPHGSGNRRISFGTEGLFEGDELKKLFDLEGMTIFFSGWGKLFRRSIIEEKGLRLDTAYRITEDTDFVMRYLENCGAVYLVDECLYRYMQVNSSSLTSVRDPEALRKAAYNIAGRYKSLMQKWGVTEEEAERVSSEYLFKKLKTALYAKLGSKARRGDKREFYSKSLAEDGFGAFLKNGSLSSRILASGFAPASAYVRLHEAYLSLRKRR